MADMIKETPVVLVSFKYATHLNEQEKETWPT
jgi:hypothetical protein